MKQNKPDGRCATCPRWDRWHIRIPNPEDQKKIFELYQRSGAKTKSDFLRARLLDESFKVIIEDESAEEYYRKLSSITAQMHKIGILYNQTVRAINSYHSVKAAQVMLQRLEQFSQQIITLGDHCASPPLHCSYLLPSKIGIFRLRSGIPAPPPCPFPGGSSSREGAFLGYLVFWSTRSPGIRFRLYAIASKIFCVCVRSSPR